LDNHLKLGQISRHTNIWNAILLLMLAFFTWLMAGITVNYIPYNTDVGFLRIKQQYIGVDHWRIAFFIHVYASIWVLLAGFTQFSKSIQRNNRRLHRIMGYIYVTDVLLITGPAGMLMGFYANGGITSLDLFYSHGVDQGKAKRFQSTSQVYDKKLCTYTFSINTPGMEICHYQYY
jgi:hypothetical protein